MLLRFTSEADAAWHVDQQPSAEKRCVVHHDAAAAAERAQSSESCVVLPDFVAHARRFMARRAAAAHGRLYPALCQPPLIVWSRQLLRGGVQLSSSSVARALLRGGRLGTLTTPLAFSSFAARRTNARSRSRTTSSLARSVSSAPRSLLFASPATTSRSVLASRRRALALRAPTSTRSARGPARSTSAASS